MLKKLFTLTLLALASNCAQASNKPKHPKPKQEEQAREAKRHKAAMAAWQAARQVQAATSLAASPAANTDKPASSHVAAADEAETAAKLQVLGPKTSVALDPLDPVIGGQTPLQEIILGYLENEWFEIKEFTGRGRVDAIASTWKPDGKQLAYAPFDHTIRIWNLATQEITTVIIDHNKTIKSLAYSSDGKYLASASCDKIKYEDAETTIIKIWDAETWQEVRTLTDEFVTSVAWSPDGNYIASCSRYATKIWNVATGKTIQTFPGSRHCGLACLAWSPNGEQLALGGGFGTKIWDVATGKEIRELEGGYVYSVAWSPDGQKLASSSLFCATTIWKVATGEPIKTLNGHRGVVNSISWSKNGKLLATGSDDSTIKIWDAATGAEIKTLDGHHDQVKSVAWSPDGNYLASSSKYKTLKIWQNQSSQIKTAAVNSSNKYKALNQELEQIIKFKNHQNIIPIISGYLGLWHEVKTITGHGDAVFLLDWLPNKQLKSASTTTFKTWNVETGKEIKTEVVPNSYVLKMSSPSWDGKYWAVRDGNTIVICDVKSKLKELKGHTDYIEAVEWSPGGTYIASGSNKSRFSPGLEEKTIKIWDVKSGKEVKTITGYGVISLIAWSPNGKFIAFGCGDKIEIWDVESNKEVKTLVTLHDVVNSLAWSPDSTYIASGCDDKIEIWDALAGKCIYTLCGHSKSVDAIAWSPDSEYIASGSSDKTIKIWKKY